MTTEIPGFEHQGHECRCGGYHAGITRSQALDELTDLWRGEQHFFVPVCGQTLVAAAPFLERTAQMLYLDLEAIGAVVKIGPGAMENLMAMVARVVPFRHITGIYVVPAGLPLEQMQAAFPGCFTDEVPSTSLTRIMLPANGEKAAPLATLMLDVAALSDPEFADLLASHIMPMSADDDL